MHHGHVSEIVYSQVKKGYFSLKSFYITIKSINTKYQIQLLNTYLYVRIAPYKIFTTHTNACTKKARMGISLVRIVEFYSEAGEIQ